MQRARGEQLAAAQRQPHLARQHDGLGVDGDQQPVREKAPHRRLGVFRSHGPQRVGHGPDGRPAERVEHRAGRIAGSLHQGQHGGWVGHQFGHGTGAGRDFGVERQAQRLEQDGDPARRVALEHAGDRRPEPGGMGRDLTHRGDDPQAVVVAPGQREGHQGLERRAQRLGVELVAQRGTEVGEGGGLGQQAQRLEDAVLGPVEQVERSQHRRPGGRPGGQHADVGGDRADEVGAHREHRGEVVVGALTQPLGDATCGRTCAHPDHGSAAERPRPTRGPAGRLDRC